MRGSRGQVRAPPPPLSQNKGGGGAVMLQAPGRTSGARQAASVPEPRRPALSTAWGRSQNRKEQILAGLERARLFSLGRERWFCDHSPSSSLRPRPLLPDPGSKGSATLGVLPTSSGPKGASGEAEARWEGRSLPEITGWTKIGHHRGSFQDALPLGSNPSSPSSLSLCPWNSLPNLLN